MPAPTKWRMSRSAMCRVAINRTGEIHHANLLKAVRAAGYRDPIGLEFMPLDQNDARAVTDMLALGVA